MTYTYQTEEKILERIRTESDLVLAVLYCAKNKALVEQFDRLNKSNLSLKGTSLDLMIDEATGKQRQDILDFIAFVDECIYQRIPMV
jgi:hypothetical protein